MPIPPVPEPLGERFERAVALTVPALRARDGAAGSAPAIALAFAACALVLDAGGSEAEAIAALAHAVPTSDFGDDVAALVACAADVDAPGVSLLGWFDRRRDHVDRVAALGDDPGAQSARLVGAAIELARARALSERLARESEAFRSLPGKKFGTLWRSRALLDAYGGRDGRHARLARETAAIVVTLAGKPVSTAELLAAFLVDDTVPEMQKGSLRETIASS